MRYVGLFWLLLGGLASNALASHAHHAIQREPNQGLVTTAQEMRVAWGYFIPAWGKSQAEAIEEEKENVFLRYLLTDPMHRLGKDFQVPSHQRERVLFWLRVYAFHNSRVQIVHDVDDPSMIYGYIDYSPLYQCMPRSIYPIEVQRKRIERAVLKRLAEEIRIVSGKGVPSTRNREALARYLFPILGRLPEKKRASRGDILARHLRAQLGQQETLLMALRRSHDLLPQMETIFEQQGLPVGLTRVPFVESSFRPTAHSKSGAVGVWQFIPGTARQFIHEHDKTLWKNTLLQTYGAANLFKRYRKSLPDWGTTVVAFNSGIGRVKRLLASHHLHSVEALMDLPRSQGGLRFAGRNYFAEVLAVHTAIDYSDRVFSGSQPSVDKMISDSLLPTSSLYCKGKN